MTFSYINPIKWRNFVHKQYCQLKRTCLRIFPNSWIIWNLWNYSSMALKNLYLHAHTEERTMMINILNSNNSEQPSHTGHQDSLDSFNSNLFLVHLKLHTSTQEGYFVKKLAQYEKSGVWSHFLCLTIVIKRHNALKQRNKKRHKQEKLLHVVRFLFLE